MEHDQKATTNPRGLARDDGGDTRTASSNGSVTNRIQGGTSAERPGAERADTVRAHAGRADAGREPSAADAREGSEVRSNEPSNDSAPADIALPKSGDTGAASGTAPAKIKAKKKGKKPNNVRRIRIERMMSKAELARRANLSVLTIDRVEKGFGCRMDTKRKILEALGLSLADRVRVFGEEE
ncbi:MAG: helix-turn-helix transcriptional regulator [Myxococcota bacterium]